MSYSILVLLVLAFIAGQLYQITEILKKHFGPLQEEETTN